jgi:hypothetical protein
MTKPTKEKADSLYWVVEHECHRLQALVAMSHAKRGNQTVLMTGRKVTEEQREELNASMVEVVTTR